MAAAMVGDTVVVDTAGKAVDTAGYAVDAVAVEQGWQEALMLGQRLWLIRGWVLPWIDWLSLWIRSQGKRSISLASTILTRD